MKAIILLILGLSLSANANDTEANTFTEKIELTVQLFGGSPQDIVSYADTDLRYAILRVCGSKEKFKSLTQYNLALDLNGFGATASDHLTVNFDSHDSNGPLVQSLDYPKGNLTAEIVCLK